jgi:hypothetical protein
VADTVYACGKHRALHFANTYLGLEYSTKSDKNSKKSENEEK